jgi:hypothetical protein
MMLDRKALEWVISIGISISEFAIHEFLLPSVLQIFHSNSHPAAYKANNSKEGLSLFGNLISKLGKWMLSCTLFLPTGILNQCKSKPGNLMMRYINYGTIFRVTAPNDCADRGFCCRVAMKPPWTSAITASPFWAAQGMLKWRRHSATALGRSSTSQSVILYLIFSTITLNESVQNSGFRWCDCLLDYHT